jgi:hypothetical protein
MRVEIYDHILRYHVTSESRGVEVKHLVDLGGFDGNGECSCEHFQIRLYKRLENGNPYNMPTRCKHIDEARRYVLDAFVAANDQIHP